MSARLFQFVLALLLTAPATAYSTTTVFPYVAYVTADTVVRSGPATTYYPTAKARRGTAVEVYRHDADGWCAIRPLETSRSLVAASQVRAIDEHLGEIVSDRAVVRVASSISRKRSAAQVILTRGEVVRLVDAGKKTPEWVAISPPPGEFRWVAAAELSRTPSSGPAASPAASISGWKPHPKNGVAFAAQGSGVRQVSGEKGFEHLTGPATAAGSPGGMEPLDIVPGSPAEKLIQPPQAPAAAPAPSSMPRVRIPGFAYSGEQGELSPEIDALELRLSAIVVGPKQQWDFADVRAASSSLLAKASTPAEKARVRELIDRIELFSNARNPGPAGQPTTGAPTTGGESVAAAETPARREPAITGAQADIRLRAATDLTADATPGPQYDAVGRLRPVVSKRNNAPRYALVDEEGEVVSFITPGPDLNLQPYLGRRIGVSGKRGFMPEFRRAHVAANRVTPLTGTVLR